MPSERRELPNRRNHLTQKVRIAGQRTAYLSVRDSPNPAESSHFEARHLTRLAI